MGTPVVDRFDSVQYDGTNEAEVAAEVPGYTFVSESGAGLQFQSGGGTWFCPPGGWLVYSIRYGVLLAQFNDTELYEQGYRQLIDGGSITGLQDDVTALQTQAAAAEAAITAAEAAITALAAEVAAAAALAEGAVSGAGAGTFNFAVGNSTVNVDITPDQAGTGYTVNPPKFFGGLTLGSLSVVSTSIVDSNTVSVVVNNAGVLALGASVLVTVKP